MERANVDGIALEYEEQGSGEPVVLIHGALIGDTFRPLMAEPALKDRFRLIRYRRRGFAGSSRANAPLPISRQAADCLALLRQLGVQRAHLVGHSSGGAIALQLALDAPEAVRSLSLLEPALLDVPSGPRLSEQIERTVQIYESGDKAGAVDAFLQAACGKTYRTAVERVLPGAMEQAVADADTFFGVELPSVGEWTFSREDATRIKQPVLAVLGADSDAVWPGWGEGHRLLLEWLPQAKPFILPRAAHLLQVQNPRDMAEGLATFFAEN
ncbi:MAG: alpha/beta hydrolase [Dehalococcoidia bacterium]|nr:alpha/beta hydrolase [Dehalococcoidia bacterium]